VIPILSTPKPAYRLRIIWDDLVLLLVLALPARKQSKEIKPGRGGANVCTDATRTPQSIACRENFPLHERISKRRPGNPNKSEMLGTDRSDIHTIGVHLSPDHH
jgi:hypothetical protein